MQLVASMLTCPCWIDRFYTFFLSLVSAGNRFGFLKNLNTAQSRLSTWYDFSIIRYFDGIFHQILGRSFCVSESKWCKQCIICAMKNLNRSPFATFTFRSISLHSNFHLWKCKNTRNDERFLLFSHKNLPTSQHQQRAKENRVFFRLNVIAAERKLNAWEWKFFSEKSSLLFFLTSSGRGNESWCAREPCVDFDGES